MVNEVGFMQRQDAFCIFFVGRIQRIQLFFVDDVKKSFADHDQFEAQAALSFALFGYFGNNPVQAGMTNESPPPRPWPGRAPGRYGAVKG